jgi:beta-glucosidase
VDYATQRRTIKASGYRYADIIRVHKDLVPVTGCAGARPTGS